MNFHGEFINLPLPPLPPPPAHHNVNWGVLITLTKLIPVNHGEQGPTLSCWGALGFGQGSTWIVSVRRAGSEDCSLGSSN